MDVPTAIRPKSYCFAPITFTSTATPSLAPILKLKSISPMPSGNKNRLSPAGGLESDSSCSRTSLNAVEIVAAVGAENVEMTVWGSGKGGVLPGVGAGGQKGGLFTRWRGVFRSF